MPITLGANIAALYAKRDLEQSSQGLSKSFQRLSSGLRINSPSDDPAGLALASGLNAKSRVFSQALRNVSDATSMLNIAESALDELGNITTRLQELTTQAATGSLSNDQRLALNDEADALAAEFNRIVSSVSFNKQDLYNGAPVGVQIQAGFGTTGSFTLSFGEKLVRAVGTGTFTATQTFSFGDAGITGGFINGDFYGDIVRGDSSAQKVGVYINNGNGTFQAVSSFDTGVAFDLLHVVAPAGTSDQGNPSDIALGSAGSSAVYIMRNNGTGTFATAVSYQLTAAAFGQTFDSEYFNDDSNADLIVGTATGFDVLLGNSDGSYQAAIHHDLGSAYDELVYVDVNADGITDVATNVQAADTVVVALGNGDGTFQAATSFTTGIADSHVIFGDFDRDGKEDLAISSDSDPNVRVRIGNGDGTFTAGYSFSGGGVIPLGSGTDLNSDGYLDIIGTNFTDASGGNKWGYFLGNGDGTFQAIRTSSLTNSSGDTILGIGPGQFDASNDGVTEVLALDLNTGVPIIYTQSSTLSSTIAYLNIQTSKKAEQSLTLVQAIADRISIERGIIGSLQSRSQVVASNLIAARENYDAASGRITDVDVAEETAQLVRQQILQQGSAAVFAQANLQPKIALELLS